jgi:hypothetical protein
MIRPLSMQFSPELQHVTTRGDAGNKIHAEKHDCELYTNQLIQFALITIGLFIYMV